MWGGLGGRERGRQGEREAGREGGREGRREGGTKGERERERREGGMGREEGDVCSKKTEAGIKPNIDKLLLPTDPFEWCKLGTVSRLLYLPIAFANRA